MIFPSALRVENISIMRKIFVIGDSVAAPRSESEEPMHGWGSYIGEFVGSDYEIFNFARSEMTTRKYFTERFHLLLERLEPNDIVLIGLGTVDAMIHDATRFVPVPEFEMWLKSFVYYIVEAGALPVLLTPPQRHTFGTSSSSLPSRGEHSSAIRSVATAIQTPLVDLEDVTKNVLDRIGPFAARQLYCWFEPGENRFMPDGVWDATHLNEFGARFIAALVVEGLLTLNIFSGDVAVGPSAEFLRLCMQRLLNEDSLQNSATMELAPNESLTLGLTINVPNKVIGPFGKISGSVADHRNRDYHLTAEIDGKLFGRTTIDSSGNWKIRPFVSWPDGVSELLVTLFDNDRPVSVSKIDFKVLVRPEPPIITFPLRKFTSMKPEVRGRSLSPSTKIVIWGNDVIVGAVSADPSGNFHFKSAHRWQPGVHRLQVSAVYGASESGRTEIEVEILGAMYNDNGFSPKNFIIFEEDCRHRPFNNFSFKDFR